MALSWLSVRSRRALLGPLWQEVLLLAALAATPSVLFVVRPRLPAFLGGGDYSYAQEDAAELVQDMAWIYLTVRVAASVASLVWSYALDWFVEDVLVVALLGTWAWGFETDRWSIAGALQYVKHLFGRDVALLLRALVKGSKREISFVFAAVFYLLLLVAVFRALYALWLVLTCRFRLRRALPTFSWMLRPPAAERPKDADTKAATTTATTTTTTTTDPKPVAAPSAAEATDATEAKRSVAAASAKDESRTNAASAKEAAAPASSPAATVTKRKKRAAGADES